jgi:hypothetical protein
MSFLPHAYQLVIINRLPISRCSPIGSQENVIYVITKRHYKQPFNGKLICFPCSQIAQFYNSLSATVKLKKKSSDKNVGRNYILYIKIKLTANEEQKLNARMHKSRAPGRCDH